MTIHIVTIRGSGISEGEPIIDPFIGDTATALQRGRNELDEHSSNLQVVDLEVAYKVGVCKGDLVKVIDFETPEVYKAKIVGLSHGFSQNVLSTKIRLRRPLNG